MNAKNIYPALIFWVFAAVGAGWAEDFSSRPTLEEMEVAVTAGPVCGAAVGERSLAVGRQAFLPYCGRRQPYVAMLQQTNQSLAAQYIDHVNGPISGDGTSFLYFTLAAWRAAANLNASGFQRYDENRDPIGYGIAQANDVMVEAVFDEIENGAAALHWTVRYDGWVNYNMYRGRPWENGAPTASTLEAAKQAAQAQFDEGLWYWIGNYIVPEAYTWVWQTSTNSYRAGMIRAYNRASFDGLLSALGIGVSSIGLYLQGTTYDGVSGMTPTFDDQGDGLSEEFELVDEKTGAPFEFDVMRNDVHPAWPTQTPTSDNTGYTRGYITRADTTGSSKGFLFKWIFAAP